MDYCPQYDTLSELLTGRELLNLFADLRGIQDPEEEISMWFEALGNRF